MVREKVGNVSWLVRSFAAGAGFGSGRIDAECGLGVCAAAARRYAAARGRGTGRAARDTTGESPRYSAWTTLRARGRLRADQRCQKHPGHSRRRGCRSERQRLLRHQYLSDRGPRSVHRPAHDAGCLQRPVNVRLQPARTYRAWWQSDGPAERATGPAQVLGEWADVSQRQALHARHGSDDRVRRGLTSQQSHPGQSPMGRPLRRPGDLRSGWQGVLRHRHGHERWRRRP